MLHAGLDLSRRRLDVHLLAEEGETLAVTAAPPDADGLRRLVDRLRPLGGPVEAAIESMNGARFVHDQLELLGWNVAIADAQRIKGLAPLACKTDKIDAWVLAELSRRDLVPAIWLPTPGVRAERERARWRLHLVRHRVAVKNRVHATLLAFGVPCPVSDLFATKGRDLLSRLGVPEPWAGNVAGAVEMIEYLDDEVRHIEVELRRLGADHPYVPLLMSAPGIAWVLGYTIAAEIGDITRFSSPKKLCGYTGLCPRVYQSGGRDHRGPLAKNGPKFLRWALIEAATHAARHPLYRDHYERTMARLGKQRGAKVARVEIARKLAEATGTCSPDSSHSLRQVPRAALWPLDGPDLRWTAGVLQPHLILPRGGDREMRTNLRRPDTTGDRGSPHGLPHPSWSPPAHRVVKASPPGGLRPALTTLAT